MSVRGGSSVRESDLRHPTKAGSQMPGQMVLWTAHFGSKTGDAKQTLAKESRFFFSREGLSARQAGLWTFPGQKGEMKRRSIGKGTKVIPDLRCLSHFVA